jgi:hypothetical protein
MQFQLEKKDPKFDVPQGTYDAQFIGVEQVDPEAFANANSKFGNDGPRLRFSFRIGVGTEAGKILVQTTGTISTPKSKLRKVLIELTSGEVSEDKRVDIDAYKGRWYRARWETNPSSPAANLHIGFMVGIPAPANAQANGHTPRRPPSRKPAGRRFWIETASGEEIVGEDVVQRRVDEEQNAKGVLVCVANSMGDAEGSWQPADTFGFVFVKPAVPEVPAAPVVVTETPAVAVTQSEAPAPELAVAEDAIPF